MSVAVLWARSDRPVPGAVFAAFYLAFSWQFSTAPAHASPVSVNQLVPGQEWHDALGDGSPAPTMIVVAGGSFRMGRDDDADEFRSERPEHGVTIARALAVAQTETTVAAFRRFIEHSGYRIPAGCWHHSAEQEWLLAESASWEAPGYEQTEDYPVSCLNWQDAAAYAAWLSEQTGALYRLPSEAEFEYFNRAGATGEYAYGVVQTARLCDLVNGADRTGGMPYANQCEDGYTHASPVGRFAANRFGLYDTTGNLWELTADCWSPDFAGGWRTFFTKPPVDGSAWTWAFCRLHTIRGGSFLSSVDNLRVTRREPDGGRLRLNRTGFRLVREF
jgi:formylglycine-generating enzyme required for sulfatase activity